MHTVATNLLTGWSVLGRSCDQSTGRQGRAGQGRAGQGRAGQGRAGTTDHAILSKPPPQQLAQRSAVDVHTSADAS